MFSPPSGTSLNQPVLSILTLSSGSLACRLDGPIRALVQMQATAFDANLLLILANSRNSH